MPLLSQQEIRERAFAFVKEWKGTTRERAEAQTFWNEFFNIFGLTRRRVASFEEPVKKLGDNRGSIDLFWKGTLLVEHKSKGKDLTKAYQQALDYFPGIQEQDLPQYVLVSDFTNFCLYDLDSNEEVDFPLSELPKNIHLFGFISGYKRRVYKDGDPVNVKAAEKMGDLHDELLDSGYEGHDLEIFLVRLIYCLFADDTGIFPKDHFQYFLENRTNRNGSDTGAILATIFQTLDRPQENRQRSADEELLQFPYVNGQLFDESLPIPFFSAKMRSILLECCDFDWSKVSPAIFGSMFQAVMDKEKRRNLGAHYTSEKNILKVVHGLFLDDLKNEFENIKFDLRKLKQFHDKISRLRFFDPACGCGNFLIITYRELRMLEISILIQQRNLSRQEHLPNFDTKLISRIDVDSMYGIEIEEFPARIAEVALWLTDHQMNMLLSQEFGKTYVRLPLKKSANIKHGNALSTNWSTFVPNSPDMDQTTLYVLGNPPFVGKKIRSDDQNKDMDFVFQGIPNYGVLDYVCSWYIKACEYINGTLIQVAFVSTNSITQGEQIGVLWQYLLAHNIKINFAHRTFRWSNEARGKAAVFCVIIGFSQPDRPQKRIYDYHSPDSEPMEVSAKQINPYLVDSDNVLIVSRGQPICNVPTMTFGSMPNDDGQLIFTEEEKNVLISKEPRSEQFFRPLLSAHEFLNGKNRFCLWLKDADPSEIRSMPEVMKRIDAVRKYRALSKREATRKLSRYPALFGEIRQPESNYVLIPRHSSECRRFIPMAFFDRSSIASDSCMAVPDACLHHFGIIQSTMHMAWTRQVCGRIKGDYRYSNNIVYNNFPWPEKERQTQERLSRIEKSAQAILEARADFPQASLSDLYDPDTMPKTLVEAHEKLDAAVDACYRSKSFSSELERLQFLFSLYLKYTDPLIRLTQKGSKKNAGFSQARGEDQIKVWEEQGSKASLGSTKRNHERQ